MIFPIAVILPKMTSNYNAHVYSSPDSLKRKGVAITQSHHLYYTYQQSGMYKNTVKKDKFYFCNSHFFILWMPRKSRAGNFKMITYQFFWIFLLCFLLNFLVCKIKEGEFPKRILFIVFLQQIQDFYRFLMINQKCEKLPSIVSTCILTFVLINLFHYRLISRPFS